METFDIYMNKNYNATLSSNSILDRLSKLSEELNICSDIIEGPLVYLDYPVYGNVGDLLIWHGTNRFLKRNNKQILGQYSLNNFGKGAVHNINKCRTICMQGGGNLGDLWPHHQKFRENIIRDFPHKRIVIFPQSVHFENHHELHIATTMMKSHPDLHIFLRDNKSLSILERQGLKNIKLCPDMAHALFDKLPDVSSTTNKPLYLLRRDKEDSKLPSDILEIQNVSLDWDDIINGWTRKAYHFGININKLDAKCSNMLPAHSIWHHVSGSLVNRAVELFSNHETIVTNRLHGIILAALLRKNAVAYDNSYGKISSYINLWMNNMPNINLQTA